MNIYIIIIFALIGFFVADFFSGKKAGKEGIVKSLKIRIGNSVIQLHHWLIAVTILIILLLFRFYNDYVYGFLFGLIIQGLTYRDFYKIIYKVKKNLRYFIDKIKKIIIKK